MASVKSTMGLEVEFMLIDKNGHILNNAEKILEICRKEAPKAAIIPEIGENMIELGSTPSTKVSVSARSLLDNINITVKAASREKTLLLPMGTYPGKFTPKMRDKGLYSIKKRLFADKYGITGECVGFHLHHALPEGSFQAASKNLKAVLSAKAKKSLVEAYNMSIALDPVLTTFMQSSPFYHGKHLGKDSRMMVYRGGKVLGYTEGLYAEHLQEFGELPEYKLNESDLMDMIIERYAQWKKAIREAAPEIIDLAQYESVLETNWSPVKINPHGTIEMRGMDMSFPSLMFSISVVVKSLFQEIYERSLNVVPSDVGIADYFRGEGKKLYVPPDDYVRNKLQYFSAHQGMENESVNAYCTSFLKLARQVMRGKSKQLLRPFEDMVENNATVSDRLLMQAKKLGYVHGEALSRNAAAELALIQANDFLDDLEKTHDLVEKHSNE